MQRPTSTSCSNLEDSKYFTLYDCRVQFLQVDCTKPQLSGIVNSFGPVQSCSITTLLDDGRHKGWHPIVGAGWHNYIDIYIYSRNSLDHACILNTMNPSIIASSLLFAYLTN